MSWPRRRVLLALVFIGAALAGTTWLLSQALVARGDQLADQAATRPKLVARMQARMQARHWYQRAAALPLGADIARHALDRLDADAQPDLDLQRQTLEGGAQGTALHLQWLRALAQQPGWPGERARLRRFRALVSYGKAGTDIQGPFADHWLGVAALWSGQIDQVPLSLQDTAPGLVLLGKRSVDPTQDVDAAPGKGDESDLTRLVRAERLRRSGETERARGLLAALVQKDGLIAAAATQSWGLSLVDELTRQPDSMMLADAGASLEPDAMAALRARLLLAPDDDPAWAGAWLALAEIDALRGNRDDCVAAAWAAVGMSSATWAPPPQQLPAAARLDTAGLVNPRHVQRVRFAVDDARKAAAQAGQATAQLVHLETALLLIQGQASLAARDLPVARRRMEMAAAMMPTSPTVTGWRVLAALLDDDEAAAGSALDALPSLDQTTDDTGLQAVAKSWLKPEPVDRVDNPAHALRSLLQKPWGPTQLIELAKTHADHPDDLDLALRSPPSDHVDLAQALAQTYLWLRVCRALGMDTAPATAALDRLRKAAMDEPLWAFFALGAYSLDGPEIPPQGR
ncbi:MAG: hypothetical protein GXP62_21580 [Oligoflexia bacterium]|nr:hypothetical protein [Oligoflexia bacterium]